MPDIPSPATTTAAPTGAFGAVSADITQAGRVSKVTIPAAEEIALLASIDVNAPEGKTARSLIMSRDAAKNLVLTITYQP
jgi:hypothetical protein